MWTLIVRDAAGKIHSRTQLKTGVVSIGRGADCDIVLASVAVSRKHGRLLVSDGTALIYNDEKSANGSFLNGQPVVGAVDVDEDSEITVGEFRVSLEREGAAPRTCMNSTLVAAPGKLQLIPQAPPAAAPKPKPKPASATMPAPGQIKSALPGFEFKNLDTIAPDQSAQPKRPATLSESIVSLLDQQIRGIQSHRNEQQMTVQQRKDENERQWREAISAVRDLQGKLKGEARVLYFVIARDAEEVSVKLAENSKRGYCNLILSRRHPETSARTEGIVWFGLVGEEARAYREPREALEDFVRRIASKLA